MNAFAYLRWQLAQTDEWLRKQLTRLGFCEKSIPGVRLVAIWPTISCLTVTYLQTVLFRFWLIPAVSYQYNALAIRLLVEVSNAGLTVLADSTTQNSAARHSLTLGWTQTHSSTRKYVILSLLPWRAFLPRTFVIRISNFPFIVTVRPVESKFLHRLSA